MSLSKRTALGGVCAFAACIASALPVAAQTAAVAPKQSSQLSSYRVNPGDDLEIYVWGEERLQRTVRVLPDGTFAFPLAGQIQAQGRLPEELEQMISNQLREQYRGQVPQVTVSIKNPAGLQFSVMGKVRSPGNFTPGRYVTILDALSLAGGPSEFANLDAILVIRKKGDQLTTLRFKLSSLFRSGAGDGDVQRANIQRLETGDTIIVP